jgi:[ribosomal protein S5]-alanine N-acetyltransferase
VIRGEHGIPTLLGTSSTIDLWDENSRGKGLGTKAVALLVRHLFEEDEFERIEARAALDNGPMCRVLEKLGFVREGILRNYMARGEERADYALYALLRTEWQAAGPQGGSTT